MPRELRYLCRQTGRRPVDGSAPPIVWYFRVGQGPRHRLPGHPHKSDDAQALYNQLMAATANGAPLPAANVNRRAASGTVKATIDRYLATKHREDKKSTQRQREIYLRQMSLQIGDMRLEDVTKADIARTRDNRSRSPAAGNHFLGAARAVFAYAVDAGLLKANPCDGVKNRRKPKPENPDAELGYHKWTDQECHAFEAAYPIGTRERLLYSVLLYTGARISDVARLGPGHVKDGVITFRTKKTGTLVPLPLLPDLEAVLAASKIGTETWVTGARGGAVTEGELGRFMREICNKIGLRKCSAHGLRKRAASLLAEAGLGDEQMKAIFGWTDSKMSGHYTRNANKAKLAEGLRRLGKMDRIGNVYSLTSRHVRDSTGKIPGESVA
jgi:integrase